MGLTTEQLGTLQDLKDEGLSIRDIADDMGVSKSAVERGLKTLASGEAEVEIATRLATVTPTQPSKKNAKPVPDNESLRLRLEHEREMQKLDLESEHKRDERELRSRELSVREKEAEAAALKVRSYEPETPRREDKTEKKKALFLTQYTRLTKEFFDNCQDSTWDEDEVEDYLRRAEELQERIEKFSDKEVIDHEGLAIWVNLDNLIEAVADQKEEQTGTLFGKSDVEFDLFDEVAEEMEERCEVSDFEDEFIELDDDEVDEDEPGEDQESEDEEELTELEAQRERWIW